MGPRALLMDASALELLFELLCVRDLRVCAQALRGRAVLTPGGYAMKRPDGMFVLSVMCLTV